MIQTISRGQFHDAFRERERGEQFSYKGLGALYDYLEEYEEGTGENVELDVIALCCEYTEYATAFEAMEQYQPEDMPLEGEEKNEAAELEWLGEHTQVTSFEGGVIIQNF